MAPRILASDLLDVCMDDNRGLRWALVVDVRKEDTFKAVHFTVRRLC
jgi:hypothetical protein